MLNRTMELVWLKKMDCPVCTASFQSENVRQHKLRQLQVDEDFHTHFDQFSPLYYANVVCPDCYYTERRAQFSEIEGRQLTAVKTGIQALKENGTGFNFRYSRNFTMALKSFELGAITVELKGETSDVIGGMYLRAAWVCREVGESDLEQVYLKKTIGYYEKAYLNEGTEFGQLGTCGFQYLMGEIYRRLGDLKKAIEMYTKAVSNKEIKQKRQVERMARDQLSMAKAEYKEQS